MTTIIGTHPKHKDATYDAELSDSSVAGFSTIDGEQYHVKRKDLSDTHPNKKIQSNESTLNLIESIAEGDTITSARMFNEALRVRIDEKVAEKKKEVAKEIIPKSHNHDLIMKVVTGDNKHMAAAAARNAPHPEHHAAILNGKGVHLHTKLELLKNPYFYNPVKTEPKDSSKDKKEPTVGDFMKHINKFNKGSK